MTDLAFILCAGLGERLRPMTLATPKPLVPIWNRPLLAHTLDALAAWGIRTAYLNTHWLPEALRAFIADHRGPITLHELHEPTLLGTGGALRNLAPHLGGKPFWLVNGDILFHTLDTAPIIEAFHASGDFAAAWLLPDRGPRTVEMDYAGRITCWRSPTPAIEHTYTFSGVSLLSPAVLDFLPADKPACALTEAFENAAFANTFVRGAIVPQAYWNDAGTPENYLRAHRDTLGHPTYAAHAKDAQPDPVRRALEALKMDSAETVVAPLGTRGSNRTLWRLAAPKKHALLLAYDAETRPENARYAACAKALAKAKVAVPKVLLDEPGLLALQDLGDDTLDRHLPLIREDYLLGCDCDDPTHHHDHGSPQIHQVMELLAALHRADVGDLPLEAPFDQALCDWEIALHEQFAAPFSPEAKAAFARIHAALLAEPRVLIHRDFQSSNILWHDKRPWLIDFQGMRRGPAAYDLAAFLYDPYVDWPEATAEDALRAYAHASGRDHEALRAILPLAGIQRLTQAIGAYHRLASVGQPRFLAYVPIARARAAALAEAANLPALAQTFRD